MLLPFGGETVSAPGATGHRNQSVPERRHDVASCSTGQASAQPRMCAAEASAAAADPVWATSQPDQWSSRVTAPHSQRFAPYQRTANEDGNALS